MKRRRVTQMVVITAIILVPALYTFMFLGAYWDPVSNMSNVPVAVVNCDQGATVQGEYINLGEVMTDSLKSGDEVKWIFTTEEDAEEGVQSQRYYAELIIPEDFTENISTVSEKTKVQGVLYYKANDMLGTMATSLMSNISRNLEQDISGSISKSIVDNFTEELQGLPSNTQKVSVALVKLDEGSKQLQQGMAQLSQGQTAFNGGFQSLTASLKVYPSMLGNVPGIPLSLTSGLNSAVQASNILNEKSKSLVLGDQKIYTGLTQLNGAIKQMRYSVDNSVSQLSDQTLAMQGLGQYIADPIKMESSKIGEATNIGTAMTPFMVSLCLYLGGFMIMITIFSIEQIKFKEINLTDKIKIDIGLFRYTLIGVAQAILIAFVVLHILGVKVQDSAQFYGICILGSLAFTTLIQAVILLFKDLGKLLCLLFMMCQIVASGGVIPEKLLPAFYSGMYPYMPMTYLVKALRNVILYIDPISYQHCIFVLAGIAIISALFVIIFSFLTQKREAALSV